jgi:hypothetical protein
MRLLLMVAVAAGCCRGTDNSTRTRCSNNRRLVKMHQANRIHLHQIEPHKIELFYLAYLAV